MSLVTMQNMCKLLNVSADYLLLGIQNNDELNQDIYNAIMELDSKYYSLAIDSINNLKRLITIAEMKNKDL